MNNLRKKDVINDTDIDTFETIEINKIKSTIYEPKKSIFTKLRWALVVPALILAFVFVANAFDNPEINPRVEGIELAELNPITLSDLPTSLQGLQNHSTATNIRFLSNFTPLTTSITFDDEVDVTGEAQQHLENIIDDETYTNEAKEIFNDLYENIMFLTLDEVASFGKDNEYFFVVNEDGTYIITLQMEKTTTNTIIEATTFYEDDELFFQVTLEEEKDGNTSLYRVKYNEEGTKKYQYGKFYNQNGNLIESYVSVVQEDTYTNVVAIHTANNETYEIVANANDLHGVIFSNYTTEGTDITSTEYYNHEGALLKQEVGFQDLTMFSQALGDMYENFENNPDINTYNLSDEIVDFNDPESFVIEIPLASAALVAIQEVPVTLVVDETTSYTINYTYKNLLYTKKEADFTSGDTLYRITNNEVTDTSILLTFSALYQIPTVEVGPNSNEYYIVHKYMAKYIEAEEGYSIAQKTNGKYELINNAILGEIGDRIDIDIIQENYFVDGVVTPTTVFEHTCDIQFENLVFSEMDTIDAARVNLHELYNELMPTTQELEAQYQSIDISMFE